jgi:hypothetical protein
LKIIIPQNSMVTYYLNFLLFVIHWDILENWKVWIESMMVMIGASCILVTSIVQIGLRNDEMPWTFVLSKCFLSYVSTFYYAH